MNNQLLEKLKTIKITDRESKIITGFSIALAYSVAFTVLLFMQIPDEQIYMEFPSDGKDVYIETIKLDKSNIKEGEYATLSYKVSSTGNNNYDEILIQIDVLTNKHVLDFRFDENREVSIPFTHDTFYTDASHSPTKGEFQIYVDPNICKTCKISADFEISVINELNGEILDRQLFVVDINK